MADQQLAPPRSLAVTTKEQQAPLRSFADILADLTSSFMEAAPGLPGFAAVGPVGRGAGKVPGVMKKVADVVTEVPEGGVLPRTARFLEFLARRFSNKPAQVADLMQEGAKAITEVGASKGGEIMSTAARPIARHAMRDYQLAGMTSSGAQKRSLVDIKRLEETLKTRYGNVSDEMLLYHWRKDHPGATLRQVQELRMGGLHAPASLDQMFSEGFNPPAALDEVAQLKERANLADSAFAKLAAKSPGQAQALKEYLAGQPATASRQVLLSRAIKSMQKLMDTEQITLKGATRKGGYKPVGPPTAPEGAPPESVGAAAARQTPGEYAQTPEFRKIVNDYARFVMGKGPEETKAADPEIQRQLSSAWRQNMGGQGWEVDNPDRIPNALWDRMMRSTAQVEADLRSAGYKRSVESGLRTPGMPLLASDAEDLAAASQAPVVPAPRARDLYTEWGTRPIFDIKTDEWLRRR